MDISRAHFDLLSAKPLLFTPPQPGQNTEFELEPHISETILNYGTTLARICPIHIPNSADTVALMRDVSRVEYCMRHPQFFPPIVTLT